MKSQRTHSPPPIVEYLRPEDSYYNFNVTESLMESQADGVEAYSVYDYDQVLVSNPVSAEKIKNSLSMEYNLADWLDLIESDCDLLGIE